MKLPTSLRQVIEEGLKIIDGYQDEISDLVKNHYDEMDELILAHRTYEDEVTNTIETLQDGHESKLNDIITLLRLLSSSIEYSEDSDENMHSIESINEKTDAIISYIEDMCTLGYAHRIVS